MSNQVPNAAKLRELNRELGIRKHFYPQQVMQGKLDQKEADWRIEVLEAILADYQKIERDLKAMEKT